MHVHFNYKNNPGYNHIIIIKQDESHIIGKSLFHAIQLDSTINYFIYDNRQEILLPDVSNSGFD